VKRKHKESSDKEQEDNTELEDEESDTKAKTDRTKSIFIDDEASEDNEESSEADEESAAESGAAQSVSIKKVEVDDRCVVLCIDFLLLLIWLLIWPVVTRKKRARAKESASVSKSEKVAAKDMCVLPLFNVHLSWGLLCTERAKERLPML
jgi:hypothetical protein